MTRIIRSNIGPIQKSASDFNPVEVGDTVTLILRNDNDAYETEDVTLTYVGDNAREIGFDDQAETFNVALEDILGVHSKHNPACASS